MSWKREPVTLKEISRVLQWAFVAVGVGLALLLLYYAVAKAEPDRARPYRQAVIQQTRLTWGLQGAASLFAAQLHQESAWRAEARSRVGAEGLAQFMPATWAWMREMFSEVRGRPTDPFMAIKAMLYYDRWLWQRVQGAETARDRDAFMLRAYNGGERWLWRERALAAAAGARPGQRGEVARFRARAPWAHKENTEYPERIFLKQPLYRGWDG